MSKAFGLLALWAFLLEILPGRLGFLTLLGLRGFLGFLGFLGLPGFLGFVGFPGTSVGRGTPVIVPPNSGGID